MAAQRSTEKALWRWLRTARTAPDYLMQRVENSAGRGTPDAYAIRLYDGRIAWLELKVSPRPVRATSILNYRIRESQVEWFAAAQHSRSFLLLRVGQGRTLMRHYLLTPRAVALAAKRKRNERWHAEHSAVAPTATHDEILHSAMEFTYND